MKTYHLIVLQLILIGYIFPRDSKDSTLISDKVFNTRNMRYDTLPFIYNPNRIKFKNEIKWGVTLGFGSMPYRVYGLDQINQAFNKEYNKNINMQSGTIMGGFIFSAFVQVQDFIPSLAVKSFNDNSGYIVCSELSLRYNLYKYFFTGASVALSKLSQSYYIGEIIDNKGTVKSLNIESGFITGNIYAGVNFYFISLEAGYNLSQHKKALLNSPSINYATNEHLVAFENKIVESDLSGLFFDVKFHLILGAY